MAAIRAQTLAPSQFPGNHPVSRSGSGNLNFGKKIPRQLTANAYFSTYYLDCGKAAWRGD
jgi:hypothetical protein